MGNFWTKLAEWIQSNENEIDEDWATQRNWVCNDHLCPNPYTHARGDPHGGPGLRGVLRGHGLGRGDDAPLWLPQRVDSMLVFKLCILLYDCYSLE